MSVSLRVHPPGNAFVTAFTLVELLVVISVIGALAAMVMPVLSRAKESGRATACLSNLRQIGMALQMYVGENNNRMPVMRDRLMDTNPPPAAAFPSVDFVLSNELGNVKVLQCPADKEKLFEQTGASYAWNSLLNGQNADNLTVLNLQVGSSHIPVMFDKEAFHKARGDRKGVNYLYADGHIKNLLVIEGAR